MKDTSKHLQVETRHMNKANESETTRSNFFFGTHDCALPTNLLAWRPSFHLAYFPWEPVPILTPMSFHILLLAFEVEERWPFCIFFLRNLAIKIVRFRPLPLKPGEFSPPNNPHLLHKFAENCIILKKLLPSKRGDVLCVPLYFWHFDCANVWLWTMCSPVPWRT